MTWIELVQKHIPVNDKKAEFILWEKTCFPLGSVEQVEKQIIEFKEKVIQK